MLTRSFNIITFLILIATGVAIKLAEANDLPALVRNLVLIVGIIAALSPRQIKEWERGVLLRLGRFQRVLKPGISWIVPGIDILQECIDIRLRSTAFSAEKTLTQDTVPVNVDAVLFWEAIDAKAAVLAIEKYEETISWTAQTTLRDVIGKTELVRMISDRETLDGELLSVIDAKTSTWGIKVHSVEIRDVRIPASLEDAMSRKAQADREKEARLILAGAEILVAEKMKIAADIYSPTALQLRAMNMTYESIKERGALMVIPSGMVEAMDPSSAVGVASAAFRNET